MICRYGDIAPKTFLGRVTAVLWMLAGTIILSMFSAQMTADITSNEIGHEINMFAQKVPHRASAAVASYSTTALAVSTLKLRHPYHVLT